MAMIAMIHLVVSPEEINEFGYHFPTPVALSALDEDEPAEPEPKEAEAADGAEGEGDDEAGPQNAYTDDESGGVDEAVEGEGEDGGEPAVPPCTGPTCYMQGTKIDSVRPIIGPIYQGYSAGGCLRKSSIDSRAPYQVISGVWKQG
jgi:hypothetical protein